MTNRPDEFTDIARRWGGFMHHVTRTALAIRAHDGAWALQYGLTVFSPEEIPTAALSLQTKSILAVREASALGNAGRAAVKSVLSDTASIQIGGHILQLPAPGSTPLKGQWPTLRAAKQPTPTIPLHHPHGRSQQRGRQMCDCLRSNC